MSFLVKTVTHARNLGSDCGDGEEGGKEAELLVVRWSGILGGVSDHKPDKTGANDTAHRGK